MQDNQYFAERANAIFDEVVYLDNRPNQEELGEVLTNFDVVIIGAREKITSELLANHNVRTKVIGSLSVGFDHLDLNALREVGIEVVNSPTANVRSVAEHIIAFMLCLVKKLKRGDQVVRSGGGRSDLAGLPIEINGKTLGLVGYGNIGSLVGKMAKSLGMNVIATRASRDAGRDEVAQFMSLQDLAASSDIVSLSIPLTNSTRRIVDRAFLAQMRPSAFLINTSRAGVVDENEVLAALEGGRLAGYAGDYDDANGRLLNHPSCVFTPHVAGLTVESDARLDNELIDRLADLASRN